MNTENYNILNLLERCIFNNDSKDNQDWLELLSRFEQAIKKKCAYALLKTVSKTNKAEMIADFSSWFFTYLFNDKKRFNSTYKSLLKKTKDGELTTLKQQEKYFINYLGKIISTDAKIKYFDEIKIDSISLDDELDDNSGKTYHDIIADKTENPFDEKNKNKKMDKVIKAIEKLDVRESTILILKSRVLYIIVKLSDKQLKWISQQSNLSPKKVEKKIEDEFWSNVNEKKDVFDEQQPSFPLSSKFISKFTNLTDTNIDQITKRALNNLTMNLQEF